MEEMTLREVCNIIGVSRRAVQGYEKVSLVSATGKNSRGHLLYDDAAQERIKKIKLFQDMGFSIKEIQEIIDSPNEVLKKALMKREEKLKEDREQATVMIQVIEEMILQL